MILDLVLRAPSGSELSRINLATNTALLVDYTPVSPEPRSVEWSSPLRNGGVVATTTLADVTETARTLLYPATDAALLGVIQGIERLFLAAGQRQTRKRGPRLFVELTPNRLSTAFQSEILRGKISLDAGGLDSGWRSREMEATLVWTRRFFWETVADTALPLRSKATAKGTGGVVVHNHWDSGTGEGTWVEILGSDLPGVIAAPLRLQITNLDPSSSNPSQIWVGRNETASPLTVNPILEAESAALNGNTSASSTSYSNGAAVSITPYSNQTTALRWDLTSAFLSQFAGGPVKVVAKFPTTAAGVWLQMKVKYFGLTLLSEGPEVLMTADAIQDLGIITLPPWNVPGGSAAQDLTLDLMTRAAFPTPFLLDFLHLMPLDGWTTYVSRGYGLQTNITLVDDAINDTLTVTGGGVHAGFFVKTPRDGLLVQPGADQRLYLLQNGVTGISRQLHVQAWYRERRLTL